jgi:outer membrane cobalamin receptor
VRKKSRVRRLETEVGSHNSEALPAQGFLCFHQASRYRSLLVTLLASAAFLLVPRQVSAASLAGAVLDPSGRAVAGVRVTLLRSTTVVEIRQTDAQGRYEFPKLTAGTYRLVAHVPGFNASVQEVQVTNSQSRRVNLCLALSAVQQQVVVSASLGGALASQVGSSVSVIGRQEIQDRGAQNVLEVLRGIPGVEVNQTGRRGGVTGVFIRGGNSNYNAVMVDGIPLNEFGGDFDLAPLPADGVDHVEVVRGPESALYGSNAVTGVINIVTERGEGPPHFTARGEGGNFTTRRFAAGGSGLTRGVSWGFDVSRLDTGGTVPNDRFRNQTAVLNLGYSRNPRRQVNFHFFGNANDAGAPGPYGSDPDHLFFGIDTVSRDKQNLFAYRGSYTEQFSSRFRQVTTASVATNDYYFHSPYGDSFSNNLRFVANTRSEVTVSNRDFLVAGFEYNREQIRNTYIADVNNSPFLLPRTSLAYFAENRWGPTNRLFVVAGLRLDDIRTAALPTDGFSRPLLPAGSVTQLNPRVSVAYLLHESEAGSWLGAMRLHGSFGTGIRAPNGFELAFTNNPHLLPEKSLSFDGGFEQRFLESRAVVDLTYFYNRFEDQIVVLGGSLTNLSTFVSGNLGNARADGLELAFRMQPTRSLHLSAEYTLVDTAILALRGTFLVPTPFSVGQQLIRRPRHSAAYNLTWQRGRLTLNTNAYIRGATLDLEPNLGAYACTPPPVGPGRPCLFTNPGYFLAEGGFSYRLRHGVEIYGRLNNLLNQHYEESFGYPALPLNFLAGMKFTFPAE